MRKTPFIGFFLLIILAMPGLAHATDPVYTVAAQVNLRSEPSTDGKTVMVLHQNESLERISLHGDWAEVQTISGQTGYVHQSLISDMWIKVHKYERRLYLMQGENALQSYPVALCPFNTDGDKEKQGDGGTPEGRFFVCESLESPGKAKYGARSMRLSYPNVEDARRGLEQGHINRSQYEQIFESVRMGEMPLQDTDLGGSIRIHGGGSSTDWTLGCVGMDDADIIDLFAQVPNKVRVEVYSGMLSDFWMNRPGALPGKVLTGANMQLENPALYTREAMGYVGLDFPMGDIEPDQAVCTDIVIRALRHAGLDLQTMIYEDILLRPDAYAGYTSTPDPNIDHRRAKVLKIYLDRHMFSKDSTAEDWTGYRGGDIVLMDTGIRNGTPYDHSGIVGISKGFSGNPEVINIWTVGVRTSRMDLLNGDYPEEVGCYRLGHIFDYQ